MPLDAMQIVHERDGDPIRLGHVCAWRLRDVARAVVCVLEGEDGPTMRRYRTIKRGPSGEGTPTLASRRAAWRYLLRNAARLACGPAWYRRLG